MKHLILIVAVIMAIPRIANAASCSTCDVLYKERPPTWTNTGTSFGSGYGNYYTTMGKPPTASSTYTGVCETACYGTTYVNVYTCRPGYKTVSTGGDGYYGDVNNETKVYTSTSGFVCTICPHGSYSGSYGAPECTLCPGGYQTTGSGNTSCSTVKCTGYDYTETWATPSWDSTKSKVNNLCTATKCKAGAYLDGTKCTPCPAGTYNPDAGATSSSACKTCPSATDIYTNSARTTLAVGTSAQGSTSCYLEAGTYYDTKGPFEYSSDCPY
ncbi:MAG: hypothetical protein IKV10_01195 [Alphaproteobacteria bacterium]|nr:hypothetical protein [Alphaproteobacteria bacterium]